MPGQKLPDSQKAVGPALHRRDHHNHLRRLRDRSNESGGMPQAFGAKQRTSSKLKGDYGIATRGCTTMSASCLPVADVPLRIFHSSWADASAAQLRFSDFFLQVFRTHGCRSYVTAGATLA